MPYQHQLRVRYGECDRQAVVYNANYMVYIDEATEVWVRSVSPGGDYRELNWEWQVVRAVLEWHDSARDADIVTVDVAVVRYGKTSFDFGFIVCKHGCIYLRKIPNTGDGESCAGRASRL